MAICAATPACRSTRTPQSVMTRKPRTVSPEALLADALEIMETAKINVLIIVEDGRPIGLVHLLDLLRRGVA